MGKDVEKIALAGIEKVKHFIAVASGKGGVGKSTIAVNLALALERQGLKIGILDADVYGPNIPIMMGISRHPETEEKMMVPLENFGLKLMSCGFFLKEDEPIIWRGPLVSKAIRELLEKVAWGELDCLVIDLPPGTGDPSITIAQLIPRAEIVMVTTPQEVALADVRKAVNMFEKMGNRVLGIVENMSYFQCSHSDDRIEIFGEGGGEKLARRMNIPFLGAIPIDIELRKGGDRGVPLVAEIPDSETGKVFKEIAGKAKTSLETFDKQG